MQLRKPTCKLIPIIRSSCQTNWC